jgi:hypothetical protein
MLDYIRKVEVKYGILEHIRFGQRVESMLFVEDKYVDMWEVNVNVNVEEGTAPTAKCHTNNTRLKLFSRL